MFGIRNDVIIFRRDVNVKFLWRCFVSLVKFSYWTKCHVNIITGSGIMTIFFCKGLTRNPEIGNTHVSVFPNIWRLGQVMDNKFGTNVSNRMLLNAAKFQGYSFYRCWVIKGKSTGWVKLPSPPPPLNPPRLGLKSVFPIEANLYIYSADNLICFFMARTSVLNRWRAFYIWAALSRLKKNCLVIQVL